MNFLLRRSSLWGFLFVVVSTCTAQIHTVHQKDAAKILVKTIVCPKLCLGERFYSLVFEATGGVVSADRGVIRNDTIVDIDPKTDYLIVLTLTTSDQQTIRDTIPLPVCDPLIPSPPLVVSQEICAGEPMAPLVAYPVQDAVVNWYAQATGGVPLLQNSAQFTPNQVGTYYAEAEFPDSGCRSSERSPARLQIKKVSCPVVNIRKIKH